nr:ADAM DEC1-like [Onthophagus taurus]
MTSKLNQRCHVFLIITAIAALVTVIVVVWTFYGNNSDGEGRGGNHRLNRNSSEDEKRHLTATKDSILDDDRNEEKSVVEKNEVSLNVEYIKLWKVNPLPLHEIDLLYDQRKNETIGELVIRHSGHYRHKTAQIWDPHPEYKIKVFGQEIHMQLMHNSDNNIAHPDLYVTHYFENVTQKVRHDSKISDCFYNGKVKNDPNSAVAVSLCHGMLGYIHTTNGNFYIEPYEEFFNSSTPILHKVTKIVQENDVNMENDCETTGKKFINFL